MIKPTPMAKRIPHPEKLIEAAKLRAELEMLVKQYPERGEKLRMAVLELLKGIVANAHKEAERRLMAGARGSECARTLSWFQDELLYVLHDFTVNNIYRSTNPSSAERICIIAIGGYGRGLLAPGSDIDLLFLFPYKQTAWGESVAEYMLYMLWDLGFKVGHATRNISECIRLSMADYTIRTSILEARYLRGEKSLFDDLMARFQTEVVAKTRHDFLAAKLEERDERHKRRGSSRYLVEPNIKEGKGGLRDLHTLMWIVRAYYDVSNYKQLEALGVITSGERRLFAKCEGFLWAVRCHLHFLTGRAEERLGFEVQEEMAQRMGYTARGRLRATERFMKHYFLIAKSVGDLTRIICAALEIEEAKETPVLSRFFNKLRMKSAKRLEAPGFVVENGRINVDADNVFVKDPVNLIRFFYLADRQNLLLHPQAVKLISRSLKLVDKSLRHDREANRLFMQILTSHNDPETILRAMNEAGVLGRFIFDFGRIVALMQFNMYHHYTVDEHLLRSLGVLSEIERGELADEHPLADAVIHTIQNRKALFLAVFAHDIAKGRPESHSIAGARIVARLGPRLGLDAGESETAAWLVENHLLMSRVAQERDLHDFKTIQSFAHEVQSPERLKLLLILTVADIKAVGPGVWNGWKGQLLRTLFYEAEPLLGGGITKISRKERALAAQERLRGALDWDEKEADDLVNSHYQAYLLSVPLEKQIAHAELMREARKTNNPVSVDVQTDAFQGVTELTVYTPDHPHLLAVITGACAASGADISGAQVYTTSDGYALDIITIYREFDDDADETRRAGQVARTIENVLRGKVRLDVLLKSRRETKRNVRPFKIAPQVIIDNDSSNIFTLIEINGLDRAGLLYELTQSLFELNLNIASAHIVTYGEKVVDVFYVKDSFGHKITSPEKHKILRKLLLEVIAGKSHPVEG